MGRSSRVSAIPSGQPMSLSQTVSTSQFLSQPVSMSQPVSQPYSRVRRPTSRAPHHITTDWHFPAALRCCQGLEVAPANKSQALCSIAPPFLRVNGPFLSPENVILHHPIAL